MPIIEAINHNKNQIDDKFLTCLTNLEYSLIKFVCSLILNAWGNARNKAIGIDKNSKISAIISPPVILEEVSIFSKATNAPIVLAETLK